MCAAGAVFGTLYTLHLTVHTPHSSCFPLRFHLPLPLYTLHPTLYTLTLHFTLHTPNSIHYILHSTLHTLHFPVDTLDFTVHFTLYTLQFALHTLDLTLLTLHCTLSALHFILYTPHSTLYTLRFTLYTLRIALHTLHLTLYGNSFLIAQSFSAEDTNKLHKRVATSMKYKVFFYLFRNLYL